MKAVVQGLMLWGSAHWDAESIGMVVYEKRSKGVLALGTPDRALIARGEQNLRAIRSVLRLK
jgi:glutathione S-transferase